MNPFRGTITALVTPFRDGKVDFERLERHVEHQIEAGVDGLVPCGTTGESPTLTHPEHDEVIEHVVRCARRRVPVIAGTGSNSTAEALRLSHHAAEVGADGLLLVCPYYNKPPQEGLYRHFATIAREVKLPIMLYNIPGRAAAEIANATVQRLFRECENIVSIKHATGRVEDAAELMALCEIAVLSGDDPLTLPLMSLGAVGVVSVISNVAPRAVKRLTQAALDGDWTAARAAHRAIYSFSRTLLSLDVNPIPIKTAMAIRGWCAEEFRLPLCPMPPEKRALVGQLLARERLD